MTQTSQNFAKEETKIMNFKEKKRKVKHEDIEKEDSLVESEESKSVKTDSNHSDPDADRMQIREPRMKP